MKRWRSLPEVIALIEKDLRSQHRARLLYGTNSMPTQKSEFNLL
jgi:hypothetical protein